jgi:hypothetical protein
MRQREPVDVVGRPFFAAVPGESSVVGSPDRFASARRRGRRRGMLLALLLMVDGGFGAVLLSGRGDAAQVEVVALAHAMRRGEVVSSADLAVMRLTADGGTVRVATPASVERDVLGKALLVDLPAGTLLTPELVAASAPAASGVAVGMRLATEELPAATLRPGEWVQVVHTDRTSGEASVIAPRAEVLDVSHVAGPGGDHSTDTVVFLSVPAESASVVAGAASAEGGVRLLGVGP